MSSPTTSNRGLVILNGVIDALAAGGENAALAYLTALNPAIFGIPIVNWLAMEAIDYLGHILDIAGKKAGDAILIDIQTHGQEAKVIVTATALAIAEASNDPVAIEQAVNATADAYKAAFNLDGWAVVN